MSSWYSNLLTKTSSQISSLKSTLLSSEADGDTEDDTHVCRVLRDFYAEKGRPFPLWLPPDPRGAAANPVPQAVYAQSQVPGQRYGAGAPGQHPQQGGPGAAGFGSLWDNNHNNNSNIQNGHVPPPPQLQTQSLRAGRAGGQNVLSPIGPGPGSHDPHGRGSHDPHGRGIPPAARTGSYPNPASQSSGTAQDRLRQRLLGGARTTSPSAQGGPFQPPPSPGGYAGGGDDKPFMGSNAPWSNGGDDFMGQVPASLRRPAPPNGSRGYR